MIEAYLDESGIHENARVCVIAGYFGGPGQMKLFTTAWQQTLAEFGFPMKDFHATALVRSRRYQPMLKALATVCGLQRRVYPTTDAVVVDDFYKFGLSERRFLTGAVLDASCGRLVTSGCPNKPYFVPFQNILKKICDAAPRGGKAHFNFGCDRAFSKYATAFFEQIEVYTPVRNPLRSWMSRDRLGKAKYPQAAETAVLQAADLLVYLQHAELKRLLNMESRFGKFPRLLLSLCLRNSRSSSDHTFQQEDGLRHTLDQVTSLSPNWIALNR